MADDTPSHRSKNTETESDVPKGIDSTKEKNTSSVRSAPIDYNTFTEIKSDKPEEIDSVMETIRVMVQAASIDYNDVLGINSDGSKKVLRILHSIVEKYMPKIRCINEEAKILQPHDEKRSALLVNSWSDESIMDFIYHSLKTIEKNYVGFCGVLCVSIQCIEYGLLSAQKTGSKAAVLSIIETKQLENIGSFNPENQMQALVEKCRTDLFDVLWKMGMLDRLCEDVALANPSLRKKYTVYGFPRTANTESDILQTFVYRVVTVMMFNHTPFSISVESDERGEPTIKCIIYFMIEEAKESNAAKCQFSFVMNLPSDYESSLGKKVGINAYTVPTKNAC